jgi:hypothetical protein
MTRYDGQCLSSHDRSRQVCYDDDGALRINHRRWWCDDGFIPPERHGRIVAKNRVLATDLKQQAVRPTGGCTSTHVRKEARS